MSSLEVIQNDAMRVILRAPRWIRIHTLQQECGLSSLHHHILARTSVTATQLLMPRRPDAPVTLDIQHALHIPPNPAPDGNWIHAVTDATRLLDIRRIVDSGADFPHPDYFPPSLWNPQPFTAARPSNARSKATLATLLCSDVTFIMTMMNVMMRVCVCV